MLVNPTDIADGVLVNAIWTVGQMAVRPRTGHRAAANMDIASWADTEALITNALPDLPFDLSGLSAADPGELEATLKRNEVQGALQALLAARLTDAPETEATKAREAVRLALSQQPNQLALDSAGVYAEHLSEYFDEKICTLVANLEGSTGLAGLAQVRAEAYNARIVALLGAIERQLTALTDSGRDGRAEQDFLSRYRRQVRQQHGRIEPPDFDRRRLISLASIYVPTEIEKYIPDGIFGGPRQVPKESSVAHLSVPDLRGFFDRTVLLGDPGGGKTTAVKFLLNEFAKDLTGKVPFLVTLRDYAAETPLKWSVAGYIEDTLATLYQTSSPDGLVERLLVTGRAVVIFDGLDELLDTSRRRDVSERVEQFSSAYPLTSILVTSRAVGYDEARLDDEQFSCYRLAGFDDPKVLQYVTKWFSYHDSVSVKEARAKAEKFLIESQGASDLRSNPLMLSLMCILYRGAGSLPGDRASIYMKCAELLFRKWDEQRDLYQELRADYLIEPTLRHLAWWLFTREDTSAAATEQALTSEATTFLHRRGFESADEARAAAKEFVEFCRGRMWVFSDAGTTATGEKLYSFTHRTFLEYFAAWHLAATSDTPEDLADRLLTSMFPIGRYLVGELAIQIKDRSTDQGADRVYRRIISQFEHAETVKRNLTPLLIEWLPGMPVSPNVLRQVTRAALDLALSPDPPYNLIGGFENCSARQQSTISDELSTGIARMMASDQQSVKSIGLQIILSLDRFTRPAYSDFWTNWSQEMFKSYEAEFASVVVDSPALRTLALFASVISIDQALAMPGGFGAISQRYQILEIGPLVPYPLWVIPDLGPEVSPDPKEAAVCAAVGKYLVDHPSLPWAIGPRDGFGFIEYRVNEIADANLDELGNLGAIAAYAVNAEFRDLDRTSIGAAAEMLPIPPQFYVIFRDWANGDVNLVEIQG
jgi:NACHT domain